MGILVYHVVRFFFIICVENRIEKSTGQSKLDLFILWIVHRLLVIGVFVFNLNGSTCTITGIICVGTDLHTIDCIEIRYW